MVMRSGYAIVVCLSVGMASAGSANEDAKKSASMLAKWRCSTFAELKGETSDQARLFLSGLEDGEAFVQAAMAGKISNEDASKDVPMMVKSRFGGDRPDFMLGRFYEAIIADAFEMVAYHESYKKGTEALTGEARQISAETRYREANCQLLK